MENTKASMGRLMRNAARDPRNQGYGGKLRWRFKSDMVRWSGRARTTVDEWLAAGTCCEGHVPGAGGATHHDYIHTTYTTEETASS